VIFDVFRKVDVEFMAFCNMTTYSLVDGYESVRLPDPEIFKDVSGVTKGEEFLST
jgi:hypothetical protein